MYFITIPKSFFGKYCLKFACIFYAITCKLIKNPIKTNLPNAIRLGFKPRLHIKIAFEAAILFKKLLSET